MSDTGGIAAVALRSYIERVERLHEEQKSLSNDVRDIYAEAKGAGFDVKVMREIIRLRRVDVAERQEHEAILDLYMRALGMQGPVGKEEAA
jgi:uncharacterized protein (UPF0335 family)